MSKHARAYEVLVVSLGALALVIAPVTPLRADPSTAESSLEVLSGTWRGNGTMSFEDGGSEDFSCNGYYRTAPTLSVVFRCKGPTTKFELRSKLLKSEGNKVSGEWEERTYNAAGAASGTVAAGKLDVQFSGSLDGRLNMSFSPTSQSVTVSIDTKGTGIKGARLTFSR